MAINGAATVNTIEMGTFGQGKIYLENAASLLNRDYVNRRGIDLLKEVL